MLVLCDVDTDKDHKDNLLSKYNSWRTISEKPCNLVRHKTTERYLANQQKGIDAMVGLSFQPTSGSNEINRTTESMPLYHSERRGATFEKVFPAPFPNNVTNVMLLTRRTVQIQTTLLYENDMNQTVKNFFEREKENDVRLEVLPNGIRYLSNKCINFNWLHECYKPLTDEQIDMLQEDINEEQLTDFIFPNWYKDFLKTTNGCNLYYDCLSLYGEQTPAVWSEKDKAYVKALIERTNPNWMAPYNLRDGDIKFDDVSKKRWLTIGGYQFDGTQIAWDYKAEKIVAMYSLSDDISIKALKKMKEVDYEKLICAQWSSFDEFFTQETERLNKVVSRYGVDKEQGFLHQEKTLPAGHKDYEE